MSVLKVKDANGNLIDIPAIRGPQGPQGIQGPEGPVGPKGGNFTLTEIFNAVYPVGSYYWSCADVDPESLFGGTWERVIDKFILAAGGTYNLGDTGGSATVTLTTEQLPEHKHPFQGDSHTFYWGQKEGLTNPVGMYNGDGNNSIREGVVDGNALMTDHIAWHETKTVGSGEAHDNMPPYEVANCWKRIA